MNLLHNKLFKLLLSACCFCIVIYSCDKSDDIDNNSGLSKKWKPSNLVIKNLGFCAQLAWEQNSTDIDGFIIEKSRDSVKWNLLGKLNPDMFEYNDSTFDLGLTYYRIRAYKGNNQSENCNASIYADCFCDESRFGKLTDSRDGHIYKTIQYGSQTWMTENLAYLPEVNIFTERARLTYGYPNYYVYDFKGYDLLKAQKNENYLKYGVLYNLASAKTACPEGWHLPTKDEWTSLVDYLYKNGFDFSEDDGRWDVAKTMAGTSGWKQSDITGDVGNIQIRNNSSCFSGLPGGYFTIADKYYDLGTTAYWMTSSIEKNDFVSVFWFEYNSQIAKFGNKKIYEGVYVRCVKN